MINQLNETILFFEKQFFVEDKYEITYSEYENKRAEMNDVKEHQEKVWNEIFSNKYEGYYQYFRKQFESDRYVSDYTECLNLVGEYEIIKAEKNKS